MCFFRSGVDGVERQRALSGAGDAREHDQLASGKVQRDVLEVVLTGTVNHKPVGTHGGIVTAAPKRLLPASGADDAGRFRHQQIKPAVRGRMPVEADQVPRTGFPPEQHDVARVG